MREQYLAQTHLLLEVLPVVRKYPDFALMGGTALNYFLHDLPRLSVDIDLRYLPISPYPEARSEIDRQMKSMCADVRQALIGAQCSYDPKHTAIHVRHRRADIKIDTVDVIRGHVFEPMVRSLAPKLVDRFEMSFDINCLNPADIYAGKLCAALGRQHPRDLFDIRLLLGDSSVLDRNIVLAFIVYLAGSKKPMSNLLDPQLIDIKKTFHTKFAEMPTDEIALEDLEQLQRRLPGIVRSALTDSDRKFLLGFKAGRPDWDLLPIEHAKHLPALRRKLENLNHMGDGSRKGAIKKLKEVLYRPPDHETGIKEQAMTDEKSTPSQQLAEEIVQALIDSKTIDKKRKDELTRKVATGKATPEDWALWVDTAEQSNITVDADD